MEEDKKSYQDFLNGNQEAFQKITKKYEKSLIYFITRYVKDYEAAQDIYQDTILYLLEHKEQYDFCYSLKAYLYLIAKSRALNYVKKQKRNVHLEDYESTLQEGKLLEDVIFSKERQGKIQKVIQKMKKDYQIVIYLTKIEGLSYRETAVIMEKTEKQVKNLVFNARKTLRNLLVQEKVVEIKNHKIVKLLLWFVVGTILISGITYAGYRIYERYKAQMIPSYTQKLNQIEGNSIWTGTFQLAWNEFMDKRVVGPVEFEEGNPALVDQLNQRNFTKEELNEADYYIKVAETTPKLKEIIHQEIKEKWGVDNQETLDQMNFDLLNSYTIYTMLYKQFTFAITFDELSKEKFNFSEEKVCYFGIGKESDEKLNDNVEVLFYENEQEFAVKLKTKEKEEVILARLENEGSFEEIYQEIKKREEQETNHEFQTEDELKIPKLTVDTKISYQELCGKEIKDGKGKIGTALQTVKFSLNEKGGELISEGGLQDINQAQEIRKSQERKFFFDQKFVLFLKEENKEKPYLALKVDNTDLMEMEK